MKKLKNYDILLVEPDLVLAKCYIRVLERAGYSVQHTSGAQNAIEAMDKNHPKLIILELQLLSHNGIELMHELRSYPDLQNIPIILLTFVPETTSGIKNKQLGTAAYLYKPHTSLEKLSAAVDEVLAS